jgi:methylated-DNA-protein-cysteine methyltransferase-like protein
MRPPATTVHDEIVRVIAALVPGEVVSYGDVALTAGYPGRARLVGRTLADSDGLPWWRVVDASGRLVPGSEERQRRLLVAEGVTVVDRRVRSSPIGRFAARAQPSARPGAGTET